MKVYETKIVPAHTWENCVRRSCDLCGAESKNGEDWERGYDFAETTVKVVVKCEVGERYPSGGSSTTHEVDLCPACFVGKLVPWLRSQGARVEETPCDF